MYILVHLDIDIKINVFFLFTHFYELTKSNLSYLSKIQ